MLRICKYCGKEYDGDPGSSCCPDCVEKQRSTTIRQRVCKTCGQTFSGGPRAWYCPDCREDRRRERERGYRKMGPARKLGSTDYCVVCGKPYIVNSGRQKYCPDCAPDAVREIDRAQSLAWNAANTTPAMRQATRQAAAALMPCAVCGKLFAPHSRGVTCSPECRAEYKRRQMQQWERDNKAARYAKHNARIKAKEAAMTPEEYAEYRAEINAKARENYRKRKEKKDD